MCFRRRREKRRGGLPDHSLGTIGGEGEPPRVRGAACCCQQFVECLRGEWVIDFPAASRLNPRPAQRAKGIFAAVPDQPQVQGELLRERALALRCIRSAG